MGEYVFRVMVYTDTAEQAARVMQERINHEENYMFDYTIDYILFPIEIDGISTAIDDLNAAVSALLHEATKQSDQDTGTKLYSAALSQMESRIRKLEQKEP